MENKREKSEILIYILAVVSFIGCAISYFYMDGDIGIHWNSQWQIDNYVNKKYIFLVGASPILMLLLYDYILIKDIGSNQAMRQPRVSNKIRWALVLLMIVISWITVSTGLTINLNYRMLVPIATGICFIILGNYLPTMRRNCMIGVRTRLTMSDETCFRKSNRFFGYILALHGLFMIIAGIIQNKIFNRFVVWFLLVGIIVTLYYSYFISRKIKKQE